MKTTSTQEGYTFEQLKSLAEAAVKSTLIKDMHKGLVDPKVGTSSIEISALKLRNICLSLSM